MMKCLSFQQPWLWVIMNLGKRVENRVKWQGCSYRGDLLLHASKKMTKAYYMEVREFLLNQWNDGLLGHERPELPWMECLPRGAILAKSSIVDVMMPGGLKHAGPLFKPSQASTVPHGGCNDPYYFGKFALILGEEVTPLKEPVPYVGSLGLFNVPDAVVKNWIT